MILYHGTYVDFTEIDLFKTIPFKDFGRGFYLTDIRSQAEEMAIKKARLFKGEPIIQEYEFDEKVLESKDLKVSKKVALPLSPSSPKRLSSRILIASFSLVQKRL